MNRVRNDTDILRQHHCKIAQKYYINVDINEAFLFKTTIILFHLFYSDNGFVHWINKLYKQIDTTVNTGYYLW